MVAILPVATANPVLDGVKDGRQPPGEVKIHHNYGKYRHDTGNDHHTLHQGLGLATDGWGTGGGGGLGAAFEVKF